MPFAYRELQAQEALQNGQLGGGGGIPDLQPGVLASQAMIEKILGEDPRWQGSSVTTTEGGRGSPRHCLESDPLNVDPTALIYRSDGETETYQVRYFTLVPWGLSGG